MLLSNGSTRWTSHKGKKVVSAKKIKEDPQEEPKSSSSEDVNKEEFKDPYGPTPRKANSRKGQGGNRRYKEGTGRFYISRGIQGKEHTDASTWLGKDNSKEKASSSSGEAAKESTMKESAPPKEFQQDFFDGYDITGNEHDSVLKKLQNEFDHLTMSTMNNGVHFTTKDFRVTKVWSI